MSTWAERKPWASNMPASWSSPTPGSGTNPWGNRSGARSALGRGECAILIVRSPHLNLTVATLTQFQFLLSFTTDCVRNPTTSTVINDTHDPRFLRALG